MEDLKPVFAANLSALRKKKGWTQLELATRLNYSDKAVSKWERGLGLPDISSLRKLSVLLDTDTDSLLAASEKVSALATAKK